MKTFLSLALLIIVLGCAAGYYLVTRGETVMPETMKE